MAVFYRYVVNETRKEFLDRLAGRHLSIVDGVEILEDVTPAILGDAFRLEWRGERMDEGPWMGDLITPTNDRPGPDFTDVTPDYSIW